jgi:tetratricopeptide (TPR) repeat protein
MRRPWRLLGAWFALAAGGFTGIGGALVAALWLPGPWAASIGGGVAALSAVAAGRARQLIDQRWTVRRKLPENLALQTKVGDVPRVRDRAVDPILLGVHRAEAPPNGFLKQTDVLPLYIPRDVDDELRRAVRCGGFIVVVGESTAGKSRAAFEAMCAEIPDHLLAVPQGRESLAVIVASLSEARQSVLWLDDLERFLGPGGLTPAMLASLTLAARGDVILLATMRTQEYERFASRTEVAVDDQDRSAWWASREVLRGAHVIFMDRLWSSSELVAAEKFAEDPRIAKALERADVFGVAETLAAGPELVRDWRNAWAPGAHPRAAALVAAAVDCRRAGLNDPISRALLETLHVQYLRARGGHVLRPESIDEAWAWALQPVHGASSLLIPAGASDENPSYIAFDYLVDLSDHEPIPSEMWDLLLKQVNGSQALRIASEAYWRVRTVFHRAIDSGVVDNVYARAQAVADRGDYARAVQLLTDALETSNDDDEMRLSLRHQIAFYSMFNGQIDQAEAMFEELLEEAQATRSPDDEYLQSIRHNIASCRRRRGDLPGALRRFQQILVDRERRDGPHAMNTLATRSAIAAITSEMGDPAKALRMAQEILADEEHALGKDHTNTLSTRHSVARYLVKVGDLGGALNVLEALIPDLTRAVGADHQDVLDARWDMARYTAQHGNRSQALRMFQAVLADRERVHNLDDSKLAQARREFENFCAGQGSSTAHS